MIRSIGVGVVATVMWCSAAAAQTAVGDTVGVRGQLRSILRMIATTQEMYYSEHLTYTSDAAALNRYRSLNPGDGVRVVLHYAGQLGWSAEASHPSLPGQSCVYSVGTREAVPALFTTERRYAAHEFPGRALCDFDPPPTRPR